jgi:hypothetical protein
MKNGKDSDDFAANGDLTTMSEFAKWRAIAHIGETHK